MESDTKKFNLKWFKNSNKVVIINGSGGSGKDTFVELCPLSYMNVSTIDPVKSAAKMLGWDSVKDEKSRKFLSDLKKIVTEYNDYCNTYIMDQYKIFSVDINAVMFIHVREPENIDIIKQMIPEAVTLLITSDRVNKITSNDSDRRVEEYRYDYIIDNSSTIEQLSNNHIKFMNDLYKDNFNDVYKIYGRMLLNGKRVSLNNDKSNYQIL